VNQPFRFVSFRVSFRVVSFRVVSFRSIARSQIIVEKIMQETAEGPVEFLVDKKGGRVFRELEPGQLEQVPACN
jgi:hypothetical protein